MKTLSKKLFSLLLVLIMLVSIVPFAAFADHVHMTTVDTTDPANWGVDSTSHWLVCTVTDCPGVGNEKHFQEGPHVPPADDSWGSDATQHWRVCDTCHNYFNYGAHDLSLPGAVITEPTATTPGSQKFYCSVCNYEGTKVLDPNPEFPANVTLHINVIHNTLKIGEVDVTLPNPTAEVVIHKGYLVAKGFTLPAPYASKDYRVTKVENTMDHALITNNTLTNITCHRNVDAFIEFIDGAKTVNLHGNYGTFSNNSSTADFTVNYDEYLSKLPTASDISRAGYTFAGWFTAADGGTQIWPSDRYTWEANSIDLYAHWTQNVVKLTIKRVLGDNIYGAQSIFTDIQVPKGTSLLRYLQDNYDVQVAQNHIPDGYTWYGTTENSDFGYWYDHTGKDILSAQRTLESDTTVHFKCVPIKYKVTFDPQGGTLSSGSKNYVEVAYGDAVGTLPIATKDGYVFQGWFDSEDNQWKSTTKMNYHCPITLHAKWAEQAKVYLRVYLNGSTSNPIILAMDDHISGQNVTQKDAENLILQYYSAQDGKKLELVGLFTKSTWNDYVAGKISKGDATYTIPNVNDVTTLYVMVNNAKQGPTTTTTPRTTKPSGIPKTGDTAMIYTAATVMVLAAAALVTTQIIRKKKNV